MTAITDHSQLSAPDLVELLFTEDDRLPRAAIDEIIKRGDAFVGRLKQILRDDETGGDEGGMSWAPIHAAHILGVLKPAGSLELLLDSLMDAGDSNDEWMLESVTMILGTFGAEALPGLADLARDIGQEYTTRQGAIDALRKIALDHQELRAAAAQILRDVAAGRNPDDFASEYAAFALLWFAEPRDRELLFSHVKTREDNRDDSLDVGIYAEEDVEAALKGTPPGWGIGEADWLQFYAPEEIESRQKRWEEEGVGDENDDEPADEYDAEYEEGELPPPPLRREVKIGRNDPCPCGSGKKYKKCCGK